MARNFNGTSDVITLSNSTQIANWLFGTMAVVVKRANNTNWNGPVCRVQSGGAAESFLDIAPSSHASVNALWCDYSSSATTASNSPKVVAADGWVIAATTKATGSVAPRFHYYVFNTSTWTRVDGTAQGDSIGTSGGSITIGNVVGDFFAGDIDVVAFFPTALTDGQMDTLATSLSNWDALSPSGMWVLNQPTVGTSVTDRTGNGANQSSISGTSIASTSSPLTQGSPLGLSPFAMRPGLGPPNLGTFLGPPLSYDTATTVVQRPVSVNSPIVLSATGAVTKIAKAVVSSPIAVVSTDTVKKVAPVAANSPVVVTSSDTIKKVAPTQVLSPVLLTSQETIKKVAPTNALSPIVLVSSDTIKKASPVAALTPVVLVSSDTIKKVAPVADLTPVLLTSWRNTSGVVVRPVSVISSLALISTATIKRVAPVSVLAPVELVSWSPVRKIATPTTTTPVVLVGSSTVVKRATPTTITPVLLTSTAAEKKIAKAVTTSGLVLISTPRVAKRAPISARTPIVLVSSATVTLFFRDIEVVFGDVQVKWYLSGPLLKWDIEEVGPKWHVEGVEL